MLFPTAVKKLINGRNVLKTQQKKKQPTLQRKIKKKCLCLFSVFCNVLYVSNYFFITLINNKKINF